MPMVRLFIAVEVEDRNVFEKILNIKKRVEACSSEVGLKAVEDENLHITLRFIGEVDEALVSDVIKALECVSNYRKFLIRFKGVGAFPSVGRPRVVWLGVTEGVTQLKLIRDCVEVGLRRLGLRPEREEFTPHLTLARVKEFRPSRCLSDFFTGFSDVDVGTSPVTKVVLKKSVLTPKGPIYSDLFKAVLAE
ncbi:MAG: RNA 2',3'-cyclic phosphodiesterase [Sulfolobales archaeon]